MRDEMTNSIAIQEQGDKAMTPMAMVQVAFQKAIESGAALEVIDRILAQQKAMIEYNDRVAFTEALARVQAKVKRVTADRENPQTRSKYATFAGLDKAIRPLYIEEGLSLSFDTEDTAKPDTVRVVCDVSLGGYSKRYHIEMPADGKGAKGNDVMTRTHATGSAVSYGKRYLLVMIFNLTVSEKDDDGNAAAGLSVQAYAPLLESIEYAQTVAEVTKAYIAAIKAAGVIGDRESIASFERAANKRKGDLAR